MGDDALYYQRDRRVVWGGTCLMAFLVICVHNLSVLRLCIKVVHIVVTSLAEGSKWLTSLVDFSRYAVRSGDQLYGQIFAIPLCLLGSNILGIVTTSCARGLYPDEPLLWYVTKRGCLSDTDHSGCRKLYDLFAAIQRYGGSGARAAVFFASLAFFLAQLGVTVSISSSGKPVH